MKPKTRLKRLYFGLNLLVDLAKGGKSPLVAPLMYLYNYFLLKISKVRNYASFPQIKWEFTKFSLYSIFNFIYANFYWAIFYFTYIFVSKT